MGRRVSGGRGMGIPQSSESREVLSFVFGTELSMRCAINVSTVFANRVARGAALVVSLALKRGQFGSNHYLSVQQEFEGCLQLVMIAS
eukprot:5134929-Amphidinium_carterae.1